MKFQNRGGCPPPLSLSLSLSLSHTHTHTHTHTHYPVQTASNPILYVDEPPTLLLHGVFAVISHHQMEAKDQCRPSREGRGSGRINYVWILWWNVCTRVCVCVWIIMDRSRCLTYIQFTFFTLHITQYIIGQRHSCVRGTIPHGIPWSRTLVWGCTFCRRWDLWTSDSTPPAACRHHPGLQLLHNRTCMYMHDNIASG